MITLTGINRSFGSTQVLHDVGFSVQPGRMTGFVGANGSGKTTTMRIILGVLRPNSGEVTVDGAPAGPTWRSRVGYMPEERGLYPKMKVREQLVYLGRLHGLSTEGAKRNASDLLERLGLGERQNDTLESLSLGNQQRAQIAAALMHEPEALILDEPFSGLDPMAVETTLEVLRDVAGAGAPVLFSSHQLDLVERLCDDLVIIADGRVRAAGTRKEIRAAHSSPEWILESSADAGWVRHATGVQVSELDGNFVRFSADSREHADAVLRTALEHGAVTRFTPHERPLTEIFQEVVR
ncbi:ABC transporter ATP-binding protein [Humidisolicoccus flavus]|uniref:ABC transporter ATP-binding protein n=1 Tax=Humidisolicoccus flavus TaxID=3111414 RepID=UPI003251D8EA